MKFSYIYCLIYINIVPVSLQHPLIPPSQIKSSSYKPLSDMESDHEKGFSIGEPHFGISFTLPTVKFHKPHSGLSLSLEPLKNLPSKPLSLPMETPKPSKTSMSKKMKHHQSHSHSGFSVSLPHAPQFDNSGDIIVEAGRLNFFL